MTSGLEETAWVCFGFYFLVLFFSEGFGFPLLKLRGAVTPFYLFFLILFFNAFEVFNL